MMLTNKDRNEIENVLYEKYDYRDENGDLDYRLEVADINSCSAIIETHCADYAIHSGTNGQVRVALARDMGKWEIRGEFAV